MGPPEGEFQGPWPAPRQTFPPGRGFPQLSTMWPPSHKPGPPSTQRLRLPHQPARRPGILPQIGQVLPQLTDYISSHQLGALLNSRTISPPSDRSLLRLGALTPPSDRGLLHPRGQVPSIGQGRLSLPSGTMYLPPERLRLPHLPGPSQLRDYLSLRVGAPPAEGPWFLLPPPPLCPRWSRPGLRVRLAPVQRSSRRLAN